MKIIDPIYGKFEIKESVIIDLLKDPTVLRLKKMKQGGTTATINGYEEFSRYDHSVGVMLLVRHLGGSIEEQIASLLHDISHTAFSHIIDYVFKKNLEQDYHESIKEELVNTSNIPYILEKHNINLKHILNEHNFSLLEKPLPFLCADRVDYGLRTMYFYLNKHDRVKKYFKALINFNNEIIFNDRDLAISFAKDFLELDKKIYTNLKNMTAYLIMADAISRALEQNYISKGDFFTSDDELLSKLESSKDKTIKHLLSLITKDLKVEVNEKNYDYLMKTKMRIVNPKYLAGENVLYAFDFDKDLSKETQKYSKMLSNPIPIKIIN